ncbi:MAG: metal-dependent transcriptional regulator [Flavobacteriales bacterium]|nr:MAG: metal-dependent transcriptional regulator [Flavobacteriales bacterium]
MLTRSEEDHLKAVHRLLEAGIANTNAIAERLQTKASSVTVMLQKLGEKGLLNYQPYKGVTLTRKGREHAIALVRKHRLWETFLVQHLGFGWDEVHEVAEQLEHIQSTPLVDRLDDFLGNPAFDPHGDPIPSKSGALKAAPFKALATVAVGSRAVVAGVGMHSRDFLRFLSEQELGLGAKLQVLARNEFDGSMSVKTGDGRTIQLGHATAEHILVR